MAKEINIILSAERLKAKAGEKIRIVCAFDQPAYASVNERRDVKGYQNVIRTSEKVLGIDIMAEVHEDTTDFIVLTDSSCVPHLADNQNTVAAWYHVAVGDDGQEEDLGEFQYKVGLVSDLHICKANNGDKDNWWDEDDFKAAMNIFAADKDVKFIAACGDIAESQTNNAAKYPDSTCEADYKEFIDIFDVKYWQKQGLRFFSPLGNHDFYGIFESRKGDTITGKKNSETTSGYNASVNTRINSWASGQHVNAIVSGRSRIVFDLENGKHTVQGQADMNFFAYNAYVDIYAKQAGYTGASIWDSKKGGISDEAILLTKSYVNSHWDECKDHLSGWQGGSLHGRNGYSKLNYYLKKDNNLYVFLSVDYGDDVWGVNDKWHDRMIHARTIINLDTDDPFVRRMKEYVGATEYGKDDEPYNYQYYSPNTLIWLKELVESNPDKKIFVFTHHYVPSIVGNSIGIPHDGAWQYADIHKNGELTADGLNVGSNCLTGIEYWFIDMLLSQHHNVIWFSGHSHISWESPNHIDNHNYNIVDPELQDAYVYTKFDNEIVDYMGYCVSLPSLSKPRTVSGSESQRLYADAEITMMEVYEHGVKIKGYKIRKDNQNVYDGSKPLQEHTLKLLY